MTQRRVGIVVNNWPAINQPPGGTGRNARDLASLLAGGGWRVSALVLTPDPTWTADPSMVAEDDLDVLIAPTPRWSYRATYRNVAGEQTLVSWLRSRRPDVVYIVHPGEAGVSAGAVTAREGFAVVLTAPDAYLFCHMGHLINPQIQRPVCELPVAVRTCAACMSTGTGLAAEVMIPLQEERRALAAASVAAGPVVSDSRYMKSELERSLAGEYRHVPLPVIGARIPDEPPAPGPLRVGFFGTPTWRKGLDTLLRAFEGVSDAELLIFAPEDDPYDHRFARSVVAQAREISGVTWRGPYEPTEVIGLMRSVDVVAVPSRAESLPGVVKEAIAAGRPLLASRVAGIPEVVDRERGWLVDPGDAQAWRKQIEHLAASVEEVRAKRMRAVQDDSRRYHDAVTGILEERINAPDPLPEVIRRLEVASSITRRYRYLRRDERYQQALVHLREGRTSRALLNLVCSVTRDAFDRFGSTGAWIVHGVRGYSTAAEIAAGAESSGARGRKELLRSWIGKR